MPKNTKVLVIGFSSTYSYFKVNFNDKIGYIHQMFFPKDKVLDRVAIYERPIENTKIESKIKVEETSTTSQKLHNSSKASSSDSKIIHTGPRGGKYYINSKGKKVYINKKKK